MRKYPESKHSTRFITDDQMVSLFAYLDKAAAEDLEHTTYLLAVRAQFEFAGRMSEVRLLEWEWVDLLNRELVWPDSKTGGMSKPLSEEAHRLLSNAPHHGDSPYVCPGIRDPGKPLNKHTYYEAWRRILDRPVCRRSVCTASATGRRPTSPTPASRSRSAWS